MKQKKIFFFEKIKFKTANSKKGPFSKSPILNIFLWKFHGAVLGLVEFIDAKGIGMAQPILGVANKGGVVPLHVV